MNIVQVKLTDSLEEIFQSDHPSRLSVLVELPVIRTGLFGRNYIKAVFSDTAAQNNITNDKEGSIMKRYINAALLYSVLAMAGGVLYREFTKFNGFSEKTSLGVIHTHYFLLGMVFFLLLLLLEKNFSFTNEKAKKILIVYHVGLNLTAVMLLIRGITQVLNLTLSSGMNAAISGISGIGHILLGISLILLLVQLKHHISEIQH